MMQRWNPFQDLRQMQDTMDRMWRRFGDASNPPPETGPDGAPPDGIQSVRGTRGTRGTQMESWAVPLDVVRQGEDTVIRASMPGVKPEDIHVSIEDNVLTIKGQTTGEHEENHGDFLMRERRSGSFHRALRLPDSVDPDRVQPHYRHGVLTITVPKAEAKRARQIQVRFDDSNPGQEA